MIPETGQLLHASCSASHYGRILRVGKDDNDTDVIDIELFDANDLCWVENRANEPKSEWRTYLTRAVLPNGVRVKLIDVGYKMSADYPGNIECNTPGEGCYRCTKFFRLDPADAEVRA